MTTIPNPTSGNAKTSDFRTGMSDNGTHHHYGGKVVVPWRADGTIARGQAVKVQVPTQTKPASVVVSDANGVFTIGIAEQAAVAGDVIQVCIAGNTFARLGGTVAAGDYIASASDGDIEEVAAIDKDTVLGSVLGFALGGGDSADIVPVYVRPF